MAEETIPLEFTAEDKLTAAVERMTKALDALVGAQDDSTKATEDNTKAQEQAASGLSKLDQALAIARNGAELLGGAWETFSGVYEGASELVSSSLAKWDEQAKRTGRSASALGSVADAASRAEKQQDKLLTSLGRTIESTGLAQLAYDAKRDALASLDSLIREYDDDIVKLSQDLAGGFIASLRDGTDWLSRNAETVARLGLLLEGLGQGLSFGATAAEVLGRTVQVSLSAQLALASGAVELSLIHI